MEEGLFENITEEVSSSTVVRVACSHIVHRYNS